MLDKVKREVVTLLARVRIRSEEEIAAMEARSAPRPQAQARQMQFQHADVGGYGADEEAATADAGRRPGRVRRRRPQRAMPVRQRQEVQALPRPVGLKAVIGDSVISDR